MYFRKLFHIASILTFIACSKEQTPANEPINAVTSYAYSYDAKWNLIDKRISFHWCQVNDQNILNQFVNKANDTLCTLAGNTVLTYHIEIDQCKK